MIALKKLDSLLKFARQFVFDDLLSFGLNKVVRVVLAILRIYSCRKANNRLSTCMAYVNANQHGKHSVHLLRELQ